MNLILEEVHDLLDVLAFAPKAWDRHCLSHLRDGLKHNTLPVNMEDVRRAIAEDDRPPTTIRFKNRQSYNEAYRGLFADLSWAERHELLDRVSVPDTSWSLENIKRLRNELQRQDEYKTKWKMRCVWTRSGAHRLQEKLRKIRDRQFSHFLKTRNMATP